MKTRTFFFWTSTGKKVLMAASGLVLFAFVIGHLLGNLQIFLGPEAINRYSAFLKSTGELLWVVRIFLLAMVVLHIVTATALTLENKAARPVMYAQKDYIAASYASRTMHLSGVLVLVYIVYHLLHFTLHRVHGQYAQFVDPLGRADVYRMMVLSFQQPLISAVYIVANFLLATHLSHGLYSMLQSLGVVTERGRPCLQRASQIFGYAIFIGFASIPAAVLLGIVK